MANAVQNIRKGNAFKRKLQDIRRGRRENIVLNEDQMDDEFNTEMSRKKNLHELQLIDLPQL